MRNAEMARRRASFAEGEKRPLLPLYMPGKVGKSVGSPIESVRSRKIAGKLAMVILGVLLLFLWLGSGSHYDIQPWIKSRNVVSRHALTTVYTGDVDFHEWLIYHWLIGVDKFYIYHDEKSFPLDHSKLKQFNVVVLNWPSSSKSQAKVTSWQDVTVRAKGDGIKWIASLDTDEFLVSTQEKAGMWLPDWLEELGDSTGQVTLNSLQFGTNGHLNRPTIRGKSSFLVTTFTSRHIVDSLAPTRSLHKVGGGIEARDALGRIYSNDTLIEPVRIHHYLTKSYSECIQNHRSFTILQKRNMTSSMRMEMGERLCKEMTPGTVEYRGSRWVKDEVMIQQGWQDILQATFKFFRL